MTSTTKQQRRTASNGNGDDPSYRSDIPPQDLRAERCCLGACLLHVPALDDVLEILQPKHFYSEKHQTIFATLRDMRSAGRTAIDAVTVAEALEKAGQFAAVGGVRYLAELLETVPHAAHARVYAETVIAMAQRRGINTIGIEACRKSRDLSIDPGETARDAERCLYEVMESALTTGPEHISDILAQVLADIATGAGKTKQRLVETPFGAKSAKSTFNLALPRGGVVIIAARPSMGKTAFACCMALELAQAGVNVMISSYEQPPVEVAERLLSIHSQISHFQLTRNLMQQEQQQTLMESAEALQKLPITVDCECRPQSSLIATIRSRAYRQKLDVCIVDYLQLVEPDDRGVNREQQVASISRGLKRVAMQTGVALVVLSQLNRDVEKRDDKRPRLSDLRESGSIEQDADQVWLLHRPNAALGMEREQKPNEQPAVDDHGVLVLAKNRNGPTGFADLDWTPSTMTYRSHVSEIKDPF